MSSSKIIGCGLLFVMCLVSASMAQDELQDMQSPIGQEELLENVQELLRGIQSTLDPGKEEDSEKENLACRCGGGRCECCHRVRFRFRRIKVNENCCLSVTYLRRNVGFRAILRCGRRTYFSKEVSLRNPLPICAGIKYGASFCIRLYNLRVHGRRAQGCATFYAKMLFMTIFKVNLGCFNIRLLDEATESENALEQSSSSSFSSSYDPSHWIAATQRDAAVMPDFEDGVVMMENIGQPLDVYESSMDSEVSRPGSCTCNETLCNCCKTIKILKRRKNACVELQYNKENSTFGIKVTFGSRVLFTGTKSATSSKPICFKYRYLRGVKLCVNVRDFKSEGNKTQGCVSVSVKILLKTVTFQMGCFNMSTEQETPALPDYYSEPEANGIEPPTGWIKSEENVPLPGEDYMILETDDYEEE